MHTTTLLAGVLALASSAVALPSRVYPRFALTTQSTSFYLVTSDQSSPTDNSSTLSAVHIAAQDNGVHQPDFWLREVGPGYNSIPNFTLTDGVMSTYTRGAFGIDPETPYNSSIVTSGEPLTFHKNLFPSGNLHLEGGYLLSVDNETVGWNICQGNSTELGEEILFWKGVGSGCRSVFLHAVSSPPY